MRDSKTNICCILIKCENVIALFTHQYRCHILMGLLDNLLSTLAWIVIVRRTIKQNTYVYIGSLNLTQTFSRWFTQNASSLNSDYFDHAVQQMRSILTKYVENYLLYSTHRFDPIRKGNVENLEFRCLEISQKYHRQFRYIFRSISCRIFGQKATKIIYLRSIFHLRNAFGLKN